MASKKHSVRFTTVKHHYDRAIWSKAMVAKAVLLGHITEAEYEEICGSALEKTEG